MDASGATASDGRRPAGRASPASRRAGYAVAVAVNGLLLVLIHGWPGWETLPVLTEQTVEVLPAVDASVVVSIVANLVYLVVDPPRLRALGDVVTTAVGLVAVVTIWVVFPFAFTGSFDWAPVVRVLLVIAVVGSTIAIVVGLVRLATGRSSS
ncbi:hypothetical protein GCM10023216_29750 [Isoptericola chiayiensis]|uniref:Uncharacterized protein n=1 Tax=Isoptericola chiayiensis TaxID=579446 RepID=A0ABP8YRP1_9MICO|nr:hypothetical protein [Isoptericola chiayiensis]NOW01869.1 hypothetical protein [Isoptericola chiayiensis]